MMPFNDQSVLNSTSASWGVLVCPETHVNPCHCLSLLSHRLPFLVFVRVSSSLSICLAHRPPHIKCAHCTVEMYWRDNDEESRYTKEAIDCTVYTLRSQSMNVKDIIVITIFKPLSIYLFILYSVFWQTGVAEVVMKVSAVVPVFTNSSFFVIFGAIHVRTG